jgi:hypothetical protein
MARKEGIDMRVQHEVKFRLHAIDERTWDRDPDSPIEVYDGGELDVGFVYLTVGKRRMVVDAKELATALNMVLEWSRSR